MKQLSITYSPALSCLKKVLLYSLGSSRSIRLFHLQHARWNGKKRKKNTSEGWLRSPPKVNYRLKINVINYVRGAGNRFEEGAGYNHISVWLPFCFRFHLAERILSENDCSAAREILNRLYWAWDEVNSWTVPRMALWLWHYYNRCLRGPRCYLFLHIKVWPFCSLFRRPSRENPFFWGAAKATPVFG